MLIHDRPASVSCPSLQGTRPPHGAVLPRNPLKTQRGPVTRPSSPPTKDPHRTRGKPAPPPRFAQKQLDAFRATLAHGSLTRAADALGLTQPAVSKLVAALEAVVGFPLFRRSRSGVTATPEGLAFAEAVEQHFLGLERLAQAAAEIRDVERGETRVAALPALATDLLPGVVAGFRAAHPSIRVSLEVHTAARVVDLVAAAAFDVGFTHLPAPTKDVTVVASHEMDCVLAMPVGHPLAERPMIEAADLEGVAMVTLARHTVTGRHIAQMLLRHHVHPVVAVECQPSFVACALVRRGLGVAIVDPLTPRMLGGGGLVTRPLRPSVPFQFRMIVPAAAPVSRATQVLVDAAEAHIAATPEIRRIEAPTPDDG